MIVLFIIVFTSLAIGLVVFALRENINLFYPPSKIVEGAAPVDKRIRAGGCVMPGQVTRAGDSLKVSFMITDGAASVEVRFEGILPDLFAEGEAVVVNGMLNGDGVFMATEVLAKHDETYTPPEVADAVAETSGEHQKNCEGVNYGS